MRTFRIMMMVVILAATNSFAAETVGSSSPLTVTEFTLIDSRGKSHSLSDYKESQVVILAALGTECPIAKQCALKLQRIADDYSGRGVTVIGLDANRQDSLTEISGFVKTNSLTFPILKDVNQHVIDSLQATRTPEVFLLDSNRVIRYRGRVDDQFAVPGKSRKTPTREDLKVALDELLEGKTVAIPETVAVGCLIGRAREQKLDAPVTYSNQISRLLQKRCVECHRPGEIAPFSLISYQEVAGWADMIVEVTRNQQMPPWHASPEYGHFANDRRLSPEEIDLFRDWAEAGAPEGNSADLPEPASFTDGWQLPKQPDHIVWMSEQPTKIPAEGTVDYRYFSVDAGITEDRWITAAEVIPGNPALVHHVIVFMSTDEKVRDEERQSVSAFVPGYRVKSLPQGMAKKIPKGSKFIFQMHYTPNGIAGEDRTRIGLIFADPKDVTHEVKTAALINRRFKIEPEKDNQAFETRSMTLPVEVQLLSLSPHMHLRGKSFRYELTSPDGLKETLLDVPRYDFNWQTSYQLKTPRVLPAGVKLMAYASFDNSSSNLANPDPSKVVTWGEQSWDEMLLGYFDVAVPKGADDPEQRVIAAIANLRDPQEIVKRVFEILDKDKDEKLSREEVGQKRKAIFEKLDADEDRFITKIEFTAGLPELAKIIQR